MTDKREHRYFFVHVMKTAGGSFRQQILANFEPHEIYPHRRFEQEPLKAYMQIRLLLGSSEERRRAVRVFHGHFPYAVAAELDAGLVTMTLLRDPVERTLSYLRHALRVSYPDGRTTAEQVYDDPYKFPFFIKNHQAKIFALGPDDHAPSFLHDLTVDASRLETAKENLAKVHVLGLTRRYDDFLATMEADYGWQIADVANTHVSDGELEVRPAFLDRIREDNAMDIAFYEYAEKLWRERHARG